MALLADVRKLQPKVSVSASRANFFFNFNPYTAIAVNAPIEYVDSASDSEDQPQFETDEGLSLLWNQQDEDLDNALQRRKHQDTYTQSWYHYLLCCFCCQPMTEGST